MPTRNDQWVLDAGMSGDEGPLCFCPIEGDINGEFTVITGMNVLTDKPQGKVVAIVHEAGGEALQEWLARNGDRVAHLTTPDEEG